jgi:hypothetical protein
MAGMMGAFSFLLENRLDPSIGTYGTPRNIRVRVAKQYLCICSLLRVCRLHDGEIRGVSSNARMRWSNHREDSVLYLGYSYVPNPDQPRITLPLRKLATGELTNHTFSYYGKVAPRLPLTVPTSYVVTANQDRITTFLDRHHIVHEAVKEPGAAPATIQDLVFEQSAADAGSPGSGDYRVGGNLRDYTVNPGDLIVSLEQPARKLIPIFLEPQSLDSVFTVPGYVPLAQENGNAFISRIWGP